MVMSKRCKQSDYEAIMRIASVPFEFVTVTDKLPWMMQSEYDNLTEAQQIIATLKGVQTLDEPFRSELSETTRVRPEDL